MTNKELETKCRQIRRDIINMTADAASGHPGGSLSVVEILACLYYNKMRVDPKNPHSVSYTHLTLPTTPYV